MKWTCLKRGPAGFALIITLVLLALLVLTVLALSTTVRVGGQVSAIGTYQVQARQNALLGLNLGLSELQKLAGPELRITGTAGITGIPGGSGNGDKTTRYWCGVWQNDGVFLGWLTSGAGGTAVAPPNSIELIGAASVGAANSTSANVEKQHVVAGKIPIQVIEVPATPNIPANVGNYAYLVTDEGAKISAYSPAAQLAIPHLTPLISDVMLANQLKLKTALTANAASLPRVISYEQLAVVPNPTLTPSVLQDTFHYVTLTSRSVAGNQYLTGTININSASTELWRCVLDTYNSVPGVTKMAAARVTSNGNAIGNGFAASASGKNFGGPFLSVAAFAGSTLLSGNLTNTPAIPAITPAQFIGAIGNLLRVRSDTFRIRAYGDAFNPAAPTKVEAMAYCEAIAQRTTAPAANGLGNKFVILYFRWLGPDDL